MAKPVSIEFVSILGSPALDHQAELAELLPAIYSDLDTPDLNTRAQLSLLDRPSASGLIAKITPEKITPEKTAPSQAVAFLLAQIAGDVVDIIDIGTAPHWRRHGIAGQMLRHYIDQLRAQNIRAIYLEVAIDNLGALALYRQAGFTEIGRRIGYYRRGSMRVDALQMELRL